MLRLKAITKLVFVARIERGTDFDVRIPSLATIVTRHSPIRSSIHTLGFSCIGLPRYYQRLGLRHLLSNYVRVKRISSEANRSKISTIVFIIVKHKFEHGISEEALRRRAK